jgi:sulfate transport system substrate-binding protein
VPVLDTGARGATITFAQRNQGDVLLAWEDDAILAVRELGPNRLEVVYPPVSIQAEPVVAVVDKVVDRRGTRVVAEAYLNYLYSPEGQALVARHYYRPIDPAVLAQNAKAFPPIETFTVDDVFGGWARAQPEHFGEGGVFDQIYQPGR